MNENEIVKDLLLAMIQKSKLNNEKLLEFVCNSYVELYKTIKKTNEFKQILDEKNKEDLIKQLNLY
ncbi:hypothetical protein [Thermoanaerobacterium sp. DL9XJH110]|uniref:hypothetical protein n=1 Tax=Thermoanaerobacterium sp. DL9XJH110 TaxID=3386643 RepID=UPI003BB75B2A